MRARPLPVPQHIFQGQGSFHMRSPAIELRTAHVTTVLPSNLQPRPVSCPKCPCGMSPAGARPRCSLRSVVLPRVLTPEAPQLSSSWLTLPPVKASGTVFSRCSAWRALGGPRAGQRALTSSQPPATSCSQQPFPTSSRMQDVSQRKRMKWRWKPRTG